MGVMFMTDLDGTLLGHEDFSFAPIRSDILEMVRAGIMIVPNSSKTRGEITAFCDQLGVRLPFICENGAALVNRELLGLPEPGEAADVVGLAPDRLMTLWTRHVDGALRRHCHFLADLSVAVQSWHLGLRGAALDRAMTRDFTAPFVFAGSETAFSALCRQAGDGGLAVTRGGRVCNLSARHDKAGFMTVLRAAYLAARRDLVIIGFGDSENDIDMLETSDIACVVPRPGQAPLALTAPPPAVITATQVAPYGWLEAAQQALSLLSEQTGPEDRKDMTHG